MWSQIPCGEMGSTGLVIRVSGRQWTQDGVGRWGTGAGDHSTAEDLCLNMHTRILGHVINTSKEPQKPNTVSQLSREQVSAGVTSNLRLTMYVPRSVLCTGTLKKCMRTPSPQDLIIV